MPRPIITLKNHNKVVFQKYVKVTDGTVRFIHNKTNYHLASPCFKSREGLTVSVNAAYEVEREGKRIGIATDVA